MRSVGATWSITPGPNVTAGAAWPATPADDQKIVTAIKRGADAVITARSSRGTQTKDTFSLLGATAMIEEAEKRCAS